MAVLTLSTIVAAVLGASGGALSATTRDAHKAQQNFYKMLSVTSLDKLNVDDVLTYAYQQGRIKETDYAKAIEIAQGLQKDKDQGKHIRDNTFFHPFQAKNVEKLYNILQDCIPEITTQVDSIAKQWKDADHGKGIDDQFNNFIGQINASVAASIPSAAGYYGNANPDGFQRKVDPIAIMTGQEIADLNGIDYNYDTYYNAMKDASKAAIDVGNFTNTQSQAAIDKDTTADNVNYLDSIRRVKQQALANGSIAGSRAANEVLTNLSSIQNNANKQLESANNKNSLMSDLLLKDAQAGIQARQYLENIGQQFGAQSNAYYTNDAARYGADVINNANMRSADLAAAGRIAGANADIDAAYASAVSRAEGANDWIWLLGNNLRATGGDAATAYKNLNNMIFNKNANENNSNIYSYIKSQK